MTRLKFLIALLLFPAMQLDAQLLTENQFDRYTTETGLSHNNATAVTQDSTGYIWIATASGLNRFNGSRFVQYHSNDDSLSLAAEELVGFSWLDKSRLAMFTSGLHIVDTRSGRTRNVYIPYHNKKLQYKLNMMVDAVGDEHGNLFIITRSGFYHFDKDYQLVFRFDYYTDENIALAHVVFGRELIELDDRRLLVTAVSGLYVYDKQTRQFRKMTRADCPVMENIIDNGAFYRFFQLKKGEMFLLKPESDSIIYFNAITNKRVVSWMPFTPGKMEFHWRTRMFRSHDTLLYVTGNSSGFYKARFYPESGSIKFYPEKYFRSYLCNDVFVDREDNLWVATTKGLFRQNHIRSRVETVTIPQHVQDSIPHIRIDDLYASADRVYAGTRAEGGLLVFDKKTFRFIDRIMLQTIDKYYGNNIYSIEQKDQSSLLLGRNGPPVVFNMTNNRAIPLILPQWHSGSWSYDMTKDSKGNIWIGSDKIYRYNPIANSFKAIPTHPRLLTFPFALEEDRDGHIWLAGHGLARYNTITDSIDVYLDSFPYIKMPDRQVNGLAIDQDNVIWFGSYNNGLIAYDIKKKTFRHFTRGDGLPDNNVASLIIVNNKLWIAGFTGIACLDLKTSQIVSFGKEDGFPDQPVVNGARFFYDEKQRQLYIAFSTIIARFNPDEVMQTKAPPHVFFENLVISGRQNDFLPDSSIETSWQRNEIRLTIGSINFSDGGSQRFAYRIIKGKCTPWMQMGNQASFSISSLQPGEYRIQVKCYSPNNRWTAQVKEMTIIVLPPLWARDWFKVLMGIVACVLVYLLIRWRTNLARKKEMVKTHIEKLKADDYKNQFELEQISNYFSSSLAGKTTEEEVLWDVTNNLISRLNYVDCMIYLWNEDKTKMIQKAAYGPKGKPELISSQVFDVLPGQGVVGHVMETCQPVLINDTRKDPRYRVDEEFRLSEVCVPIIHNDELMGIIDSEHYLPNYFTERDIKILTTIATLIGNKLKQIQSEKTLDAKRKELATINEQLAEARLSALQAQMNPHFVFNALNSIKRMILDGDNEKASRYLSKFALMIRMTLNHSKEIFVTLDENIQYLRAYLEMEQLRFDDSFTYKISTSDNIEAAETPIPSMMIQPLVENAIWHGLMQAGPDKKIAIGFEQNDNRITCTVEDNGIGIRQSEKLKEKVKSPHQSLGLENLQKRIKIMNEKYDMDCKLIIKDLGENGRNGSGTRVVLQFNLINV